MYQEKLTELTASSEGQAMYLKWLADPVTQIFLGSFREKGRPRRPDLIQTEAAFLSIGEALGWNGAADLIENPRQQFAGVGIAPEPSYGAPRVLAADQ